MKGILIKGMEMPECCLECPCLREDEYAGVTAYQCKVDLITFGEVDYLWMKETRPNWCKLKEFDDGKDN